MRRTRRDASGLSGRDRDTQGCPRHAEKHTRLRVACDRLRSGSPGHAAQRRCLTSGWGRSWGRSWTQPRCLSGRDAGYQRISADPTFLRRWSATPAPPPSPGPSFPGPPHPKPGGGRSGGLERCEGFGGTCVAVGAQRTRQRPRCPLSGRVSAPALGFRVASRCGTHARGSPAPACPRNHSPLSRPFSLSLGALLGRQVRPPAGENSSACKFLQDPSNSLDKARKQRHGLFLVPALPRASLGVGRVNNQRARHTPRAQ